MKRLLVFVVVTALAPATAEAATVHIGDAHKKRFRGYSSYSSDHSAARFDAAPGERNRVRVAHVRLEDGFEQYTFHDSGAVITPGSQCESVDAHTAKCTERTNHLLTYSEIRLGDRDDRLEVANTHVAAFGGPGDDVLVGGDSVDEFFAGSGRDRLYGGPSTDVLVDGDRSGARGDAGPGRDVLDGGDSHDMVSYEGHKRGVNVDLRDDRPDGEPGEGDIVRDVEDAVGGTGDDRLAGTADYLDYLGMTLRGKRGDDVLIGGPTADLLNGGGGRDRLSDGDGEDLLRPGPGHDILRCGHDPDTVLDPEPGELLNRHCNVADIRAILGYPQTNLRFAFRPTPVAISRRAVIFELPCSLDEYRVSEGALDPCKPKVRVRTRSGRLLARGRYRSEGGFEPERVRLPLTRLGRALTGHRRGVRANVAVTGLAGLGADEAAVWMVRLRR